MFRVINPFIFASGVAPAPTAIITAPPATIARNNYSGTVGFSFGVVTTVTVTHLGRTVGGTFAQTHNVKLWTNVGVELASAAISPSSPQLDGFAYESITPVVLTSGLFYRVASTEFASGDTWGDLQAITSTGMINQIQARFGATDAFPSGFAGSLGQAYVFPNLYYIP